MKIEIDPLLQGKALYEYLAANKSILIAQKKYELKKADGICYSKMLLNDKGETIKANVPVAEKSDDIEVTSVINSCLWYDSHGDVHLSGLWKKSLSENKDILLLQEHDMSFKGIITDNVEAYTQQITWKALGVNKEGSTECLVFKSNISRNRNAYMFDEYQKGHVKNHSVGMRYVKIELAVNDEDYKEEYAVWQKYIDLIANKEDAEETGYFWAVKEAKVVEGSAVPLGSNTKTPTINVLTVSDSTKQQPEPSTVELPQPKDADTLNIKQLLTIF
jgi:hypothetical protein